MRYSDDVKEKEVEWVLAFSRMLVAEVEKYGYPLIETSKSDDDLTQLLTAIKTHTTS